MISHCLNPACRIPFGHAVGGRFFSVDPLLSHSDQPHPERKVDEYWLCGTCSQVLKVVVENGVVITVPIDMECTSLVG
ncbi:MAG: hypothetical protein WBQ72_22495 [Terriglobales bacterium]|jgi:hypothetical protein